MLERPLCTNNTSARKRLCPCRHEALKTWFESHSMRNESQPALCLSLQLCMEDQRASLHQLIIKGHLSACMMQLGVLNSSKPAPRRPHANMTVLTRTS